MENKKWYQYEGLGGMPLESWSDRKIVNFFWLGILFFGLGSVIMWYIAMKRIWKNGNRIIAYSFIFSFTMMIVSGFLEYQNLWLLSLVLVIVSYFLPIFKLSIIPNSESGRLR